MAYQLAGVSVHQKSAVDIQNFAGNEVGFIGCQKDDGMGYLLRLSESLQRYGRDDGLPFFVRPFGAHFRFNGMGSYAVDIDAEPGQLSCKGFCQGIDARF